MIYFTYSDIPYPILSNLEELKATSLFFLITTLSFIVINYFFFSSSGGELMEPEILHGEFDTLLLDNSSGQEGIKRKWYFRWCVTIYCCDSLCKT